MGFNLPPGCGTLPGEEWSGPCLVCGGDVDNDECVCPECPECGTVGDPKCYAEHGLSITTEQLKMREKMDSWYAEQEHLNKLAVEAEYEDWKLAEAYWEGK